MPLDPKQVTETLALAAEAAEKAAAFERSTLELRKQASALVPGTVEVMLSGGHIDATEKAAAFEALADHASTLRVLHNVAVLSAEKIARLEQKLGDLEQAAGNRLGQPVGPAKRASAADRRPAGMAGDLRSQSDADAVFYQTINSL